MLIDESDSPTHPVPLAPHIPRQAHDHPLGLLLVRAHRLERAVRGPPRRLRRPGYHTIRICAMPFLQFGTDIDTRTLKLGPLGGRDAQHVRWYDVKVPTVIDARQHLLALFEAAKRHDVFVVVSSWDYQQLSAFAGDRAWFDALMSIHPEERAKRFAEAYAGLVSFPK